MKDAQTQCVCGVLESESDHPQYVTNGVMSAVTVPTDVLSTAFIR